MKLIKYVSHVFGDRNRELIRRINIILHEYQQLGFSLTLRQLFYQFVSRNWIKNTKKDYDRLGEILSKARRAGLVDWNSIKDRTRYLRTYSTWPNAASGIQSAANSFALDLWASQPYRIEVWIEKDALVGTIETVCDEYRVPFLSTRGFPSDSEMWEASNRMASYLAEGQIPIILHLADHDPSGLDMTRDIRERFDLFHMEDVEVHRIGLNIDQIEEYEPPPNAAKEVDSRYQGYVDLYGTDSWELDSLNPTIINSILRKEIETRLNKKQWNIAMKKEAEQRWLLQEVATNWDEVVKDLL